MRGSNLPLLWNKLRQGWRQHKYYWGECGEVALEVCEAALCSQLGGCFAEDLSQPCYLSFLHRWPLLVHPLLYWLGLKPCLWRESLYGDRHKHFPYGKDDGANHSAPWETGAGITSGCPCICKGRAWQPTLSPTASGAGHWGHQGNPSPSSRQTLGAGIWACGGAGLWGTGAWCCCGLTGAGAGLAVSPGCWQPQSKEINNSFFLCLAPVSHLKVPLLHTLVSFVINAFCVEEAHLISHLLNAFLFFPDQASFQHWQQRMIQELRHFWREKICENSFFRWRSWVFRTLDCLLSLYLQIYECSISKDLSHDFFHASVHHVLSYMSLAWEQG